MKSSEHKSKDEKQSRAIGNTEVVQRETKEKEEKVTSRPRAGAFTTPKTRPRSGAITTRNTPKTAPKIDLRTQKSNITNERYEMNVSESDFNSITSHLTSVKPELKESVKFNSFAGSEPKKTTATPTPKVTHEIVTPVKKTTEEEEGKTLQAKFESSFSPQKEKSQKQDTPFTLSDSSEDKKKRSGSSPFKLS